MATESRARMHARRAFEELECARSASSPEAAMAHLGLSELHLGRMKAAADAPKPKLQLVD